MGAWGEGVFENDSAGDWLDQLVASGKPNAIDKALTFAMKAKLGRLEADEACEALAATEVIAAARGHRHTDLPDDVKEWLATSGYTPTAATVALGIKTAERVRDDSELADLWAEGDELAAWKRGVAGLLSRLAKPAKAAKPRKAVSSKSKKPATASPLTAATALKKKRVFVVTQPGKDAPNWCRGIASESDKQPLTDADMEHFQQLESLEDLWLTGYAITDHGIRHLAAMTNLRMLELAKMPITDASAAIFERLTGIKSLNLSNTKIGDAVLEQVAGMKQLYELNVSHTAVTDAGIRHLTACTELTFINVVHTRITDDSLKWIARLPRLTHVIAGGKAAQLTGAGLRQLLELKNLSLLDLSNTTLTDDDVPILLQFPEKATIFALNTKITSKGKLLIDESRRDRMHV